MSDIQNETANAMHSATSAITKYPSKLLEIAQANTQFAFAYAQALAAIRSPTDLMTVMTDYTKQRMEMFQKHTEELAELAKGNLN